MRLIDADALFEKVPYGDIEHDVKISKCGAIACEPTHWMPLPEPPKEGE